MQAVTVAEPSGFDDTTKSAQVRAGFSSLSKTVAPRNRPTGPSSGRPESGQTWEEKQKTDCKGILENVIKVVRELTATDGELSPCQLRAYQL